MHKLPCGTIQLIVVSTQLWVAFILHDALCWKLADDCNQYNILDLRFRLYQDIENFPIASGASSRRTTYSRTLSSSSSQFAVEMRISSFFHQMLDTHRPTFTSLLRSNPSEFSQGMQRVKQMTVAQKSPNTASFLA